MTIIQIDRPPAKTTLPGLAPFLVALACYVDFICTPPYHRSDIRTLDKWIQTRTRVPGRLPIVNVTADVAALASAQGHAVAQAVAAPGATIADLGRALRSEAA